MQTNIEKYDVFLCECKSLDHVFMVNYFLDNNEYDGQDVYLTVMLSQFRNVWRRILVACRILCGLNIKDGLFQPILIPERDHNKLLDFLPVECESSEEDISYRAFTITERNYVCHIYWDESLKDIYHHAELCLEIQPNISVYWFKRLWYGIKYVCGYLSPQGSSHCFTLNDESICALRNVIMSKE